MLLIVAGTLYSQRVLAQSDSLVLMKLDSLIKLSNLQTILLNPKESKEYKTLEVEKATIQNKLDLKDKDIADLNSRINEQVNSNASLILSFSDSRLSSWQISVLTVWCQKQKVDLGNNLKLGMQISNSLDEIDNSFAKSPDAVVLSSLVKELAFLKEKKTGLNPKSLLLKEVERYSLLIPDYFKCLQEFEKLCDGVSESVVKSTVIDIMSVYKNDLSNYSFLRGAFYYSADYPNSSSYRKDFIWFLDNDVQIPLK